MVESLSYSEPFFLFLLLLFNVELLYPSTVSVSMFCKYKTMRMDRRNATLSLLGVCRMIICLKGTPVMLSDGSSHASMKHLRSGIHL